jgi:hypothetical protein
MHHFHLRFSLTTLLAMIVFAFLENTICRPSAARAQESAAHQESNNSPRGKRRDSLRVLFIGNSLTASNNLPGIVEALAKAGGQRPLVYQTEVQGGFSLSDHWERGSVQKVIAGGKWEVVVLQQGPSTLPQSRSELLREARRFNELIRKEGARPALMMVWPLRHRPQDFERVRASYALAAGEVQGIFLPAGEAWRAARRRDPNLQLYTDDIHPTMAGSYLAALVIYQQLYQKSPLGLPAKLQLANGGAIQLSQDQARLFQEAAAEANQKFGQR